MPSETIKLAIGIPTAGKTHCALTYSLAGMIGKLTGGIPTRPDAELHLLVDMQVSSCIHSNREIIVRRAIDTQCTHLMFLDDDMGFDPRVAEILLGRRQPVVACNYLVKWDDDHSQEFAAVALNGKRIITDENSTGLQEIAYAGFGVSLFETRVFAGTPQPWFLPVFVPESNMYTTEDNPCFERIRKAGFPCYVDHDASKLVDHNGDKKWKWSQYVRQPNGSNK